MGGGIDEASGKGGGEEIAKGILGAVVSKRAHQRRIMCLETHSLLQNTAHETSGLQGQVLESSGRRVAVETTHGHAEQSAAGQELLVRVAKASSLKIQVSRTIFKNSFLTSTFEG